MARLDSEMVSRGLARSRERAKEMIRSGNVTVNGIKAKKPSDEIEPDDKIESSEQELYVGRGALKLEKACKEFELDLQGKTCLDIGASTGGFTDYMLKNGAVKIYAVDVGHDQLAISLREDQRVVNMEKTDIRDLTTSSIGGKADIISVDVSFISLTMIASKIFELLSDDGTAAVLIKPQFEAGKKDVGKNGIVKDRRVHMRVLGELDDFFRNVGLFPQKYTFSPVRGGSGNIEYLVKLSKIQSGSVFDLKKLVDTAFRQL